MTFKTASLNSWSTLDVDGKCCVCDFHESIGSTKKRYLA